MKLSCSTISTFFLFIASFFLYPSEYYSAYPMPTMELHANLSQPKTHTQSDLHFRARYLSDMIQRNIAPQVYNRTDPTISKTLEPITYTDLSSIINLFSASIKAERNKILNRFMENNPEIYKYFLKKYPISHLSKEYLSSHDIDINSLESCEGNIL